MVEFLEQEKILTIKIVYYGPALSGKTTNLMQLHDFVAPDKRRELMSLETKGDRTLFFDLLPLMKKTKSGYKIKIKLFTVPGQVAHDATRKAVLSRADGVVFIADSQQTQSVNNSVSFENLEKNAARVGLDVDHLPLVIQYNKRDLKDIISEEDIRKRWKPTGIPVIMGEALYGKGVKETFLEILKETYRILDKKIRLKEKFRIDREDMIQILND